MMPTLSLRLEAVLSLLGPCRVFADVGTDHGLLPIHAALRGLVERAIAADLRAPPLELAQRNITRSGMQERVSILQGDGLVGLDGHGVEVVAMAGISGGLMVQLLSQAPHVVASLTRLVVQPNQGAELVRAWTRQHGWHLLDERMVEERNRFFPVCAFEKRAGDDPAYSSGLDEAVALQVGPLLLARRDATALRWCDQQVTRVGKLVQSGVHGLEAERDHWRMACSLLQHQTRASTSHRLLDGE